MLVCTLAIGSISSLSGCANKTYGVIHHVEEGENLYRIGLRYDVDPKKIARANGIRDSRSLRIGEWQVCASF